MQTPNMQLMRERGRVGGCAGNRHQLVSGPLLREEPLWALPLALKELLKCMVVWV